MAIVKWDCVHGRWKIQKHQSICHEILILFIVNVSRRFFLEKTLIAEKHLQLTIEYHLVFDRSKFIAAPRPYSKNRFVCTVDGKSKNTSRLAIKFSTNTLSFPFSFKARLSYSHGHITKNARNIYRWNSGINHAIEICVHGRWKIQKHQIDSPWNSDSFHSKCL